MDDKATGADMPRDTRTRAAEKAGRNYRKTIHRVRIRKSGLDLALIWSVIGIFLIMAIAAIYVAKAVLMPITLAIVVGLILGLAADRLGELGVPPMVSAFILSTLFALIVILGANALLAPMAELAQEAPAMAERAIERWVPYLEKIEWLHITSATLRSGPVSIEAVLENTGSILSTVASNVTPAIVQGLIFFAALLLFLGSRLAIRKALIIGFRDRARRLAAIRTYNAIQTALGYYFATASLIYAGVGLSMVLISWIGGLQMPILWGFFAFLSSFVPFLGVTLMTLALGVAGMLTHDSLILGLAPAAAFFLVHGLVENFVTPAVMGKRLEINAFAVFVAIIFWTWMWGAVGAMLALPLSLIGMTVFNELVPKQKAPHPHLPG